MHGVHGQQNRAPQRCVRARAQEMGIAGAEAGKASRPVRRVACQPPCQLSKGGRAPVLGVQVGSHWKASRLSPRLRFVSLLVVLAELSMQLTAGLLLLPPHASLQA